MIRRVANLRTGRRSLIAAILAMLALSAVAVAYLASSGTGTAHAGVGSVNSPSNVAAHQSAADVAINWNAASLPSGANVDGYRVTRSDGTAVCGSPSLVSGLSCVDSNVHGGTYTYTVTAVYHSFTASAASAAVTVQDSSVVLSPASGHVGDTVALSGSHFPAGASITATYSGTALTLSGSATTTASGAIASGVTFTVPASTAGVHTVQINAGGRSANASFALQPQITLSPTSGVAGTTDAITGTGFAAGSTITTTFGGAGVTLSGGSSDGSGGFSTSYTVPNQAPGGHTVAASDGSGNSDSATYTINTPSINLSSSSGHVGDTVTVSGSNFPVSSSITATYGGSALSVLGNTTTTASGTIPSGVSFTVPASTAGAHTVQITAGSRSATASFTVTPQITLAPTSGNVGTPGSIVGTGFAAGSTLTAKFAGTTVTLGGTTSSDSSGSISGATYTVPAAAAGGRALQLTDGSGNTASASFTVTPHITLSPTNGAAGTIDTITGTGFAAGSTITATFGGAGVTLSGGSSDGSGGFTATYAVPNQAPGGHSVLASDGSGNSDTTTFTINTPSIDSLSPTSGHVGDTVTISGSNFPASSSITATYDGSALTLSGNTSTTATGTVSGTTFAVPVSTKGAHTIQITAGSRSATASFTVTPKITLSPASGAANNTDTISGTGFAPGTAITAKFNSTPLTLAGTTTTSADGRFGGASYTVPSGATGTNNVTVTDAATNAATATYTVTPPPSLVLNPTSGVAGGGTQLTLTGSGYTASSTITVKYDGITQTTTPASPSSTTGGALPSLRFNVPVATAAGSHTVTVTAGSTTGTATFTATPAAPTSATLVDGSGATTTIMGTNQAAARVKVTLPSTSTSSDVVHVTLSDGTTTTADATAPATAGAGTVTVSGIDARGLNDGSITINASVRDSIGDNSASPTASTTKAVAPSAVQLVNGSGNALSTINMLTQSSTNVKVTLSGARGGDVVHVTLSDGTHTTADRSTTIPADNTGSVTVSGIDGSALNDGTNNVTISATVIFPMSTGTGTSAAKTGTTSKDTVAPAVSSINRSSPAGSATNAASITFTVTFSSSVTGFSTADLSLATSGVSGASISSVSGSGSSYSVNVGTGSGNGTIGLNLVDDDSISDVAGNPLGGTGAGNGNLTGQSYTIDRIPPSGGSINYGSGYSTPPAQITLDSGTDIGGAGIGTTTLQRASATLSNNTCGTFGSFGTIATNPGSPYNDSPAGGNCYKYQYLVADSAGNSTTYTSSSVLKVDTTPPSSSMTTLATYQAASGFIVNWSASDSTSGLESVVLYVKGPQDSAFSQADSPGTASGTSATGSFTYTPSEGDGLYSFYTRATDLAGNVELAPTGADTSTTVDSTPPAGVKTWSTTNGPGTAGKIEQNDTITLNFTEPIDATSIISPWNNPTQGQNVWVKLADSGTGTSNNDTITICAASDTTCSTPLAIGTINLKGDYIDSASGNGVALFQGSGSGAKSSIAFNSQGTTLTVTLGIMSSNTGTLVTQTSASQGIWSGWSFKDLAGNQASSAASTTQVNAQKQF